jgi:hypothetical protein
VAGSDQRGVASLCLLFPGGLVVWRTDAPDDVLHEILGCRSVWVRLEQSSGHDVVPRSLEEATIDGIQRSCPVAAFLAYLRLERSSQALFSAVCTNGPLNKRWANEIYTRRACSLSEYQLLATGPGPEGAPLWRRYRGRAVCPII